jgi:putative nucleotidyltransferase with HDIG domain
VSDDSHIGEPEKDVPLRRKVHVHQLDLLFRQLDCLPALPAAAARLVHLTGEDEGELERLVPAICADPSVSARLVSLVRRERPGEAFRSVHDAVAALGLEGVRTAVLGITVFGRFDPGAGGLGREALWQHCVAVAVMAAAAARRLGGPADPCSAFLCGLLHDVGKLALAHCLPKSYQRVLARAGAEQCSAGRAEHAIIGADHTLVGRRLGRHWGLPLPVQQAVWLHHHPLEAMPASLDQTGLAGLVQLGDAIACERRFGFSGTHALPVSSLELGRQIGLTEQDLSSLAAEVPARLERLGEITASQPAVAPTRPASAQAPSAPADRDQLLTVRTELQRQAELLGHLRDFAARIIPATGLLQLCGEIARTVSAVLGEPAQPELPACAFAVAADKSHVVLAAEGPAGRQAFRLSAARALGPLPDADPLPAGELLPNLLASPGAWSDLLDLELYVCLPLMAEGRLVGGILLPRQEAPPDRTAERIEPLREFMAFALAGAVARAQAEGLAEQLAAASQRLAEARQALAQAEALAAVGEMAAGAAHEINNPLAVISGRAQLLAQHADSKKDRDSAELIAEKAQQISEIATDLLAFARPDPPAPARVGVRDLLAAVTNRLQHDPLQKTPPPAVDIELQDDCPPLWVDAEQIEGVLVELVRNAVTAAGGAVKVRIEASWRAGAERVLLRVVDSGPGMDRQTLAAAFTPFYSNRPAGRGRGMGLARAKRTVQANGGKIWIDSQLNQGTTVLLELPRATAEPNSS